MNNRFPQNTVSWTPLQLVGFRFIAVFFLLYLFPFPLSHISGVHLIAETYSKIWQGIVVWTGDHILSLNEPITGLDSDGGDRLYDYLHVLVLGMTSLLGAVIWSVVDRNKASYLSLLHWLRVLVRYYLGTVMIFYGMSKVLHLQMPLPTLYELVQPMGEKNPMSLAWSYVGLSETFSIFTGLAEIIGGALLFFRRTTTLGALIVSTIMLNVLVMNLAFNISVKLYSSILLLMAVFLILRDADSLMRVLILNKPTKPKPHKTHIDTRRGRLIALTVKILFIGMVFLGNAVSGYERMHLHGKKRERSPIYGIYNTEQFVLNGDTLPPLSTERRRWKQLIIEFPDHIHIKQMDDAIVYHATYWDAQDQKVAIHPSHSQARADLVYEVLPNSLLLHGAIGRDSVAITLREHDLKSFPLINTPFRWIRNDD